MPIYEYECDKCGHSFELRRGIEERDGDVRCASCGAQGPRKVFSVFSSRMSGECSALLGEGCASSGESCAPLGGG